MSIDLSDDRGAFEITIEGTSLDEIGILRLQAAAGHRAATFLKTALGHEAIMDLIRARADVTTQRWKGFLAAAEGRFDARSRRFRVVGLSPHRFYDYVVANGGQELQFKMHPEHYVSFFPDGLGNGVVIAEPWGSAMIVSHAAFGDPEELRAAGIDIDAEWETDALYRISAVGRAEDGTFLCAIMHQILPEADGFTFKTCGFLPAGVPDDIVEGIDAHAHLEFTNMIRVAREAIVASDTLTGAHE